MRVQAASEQLSNKSGLRIVDVLRKLAQEIL